MQIEIEVLYFCEYVLRNDIGKKASAGKVSASSYVKGFLLEK
jgi:hypothetical protein